MRTPQAASAAPIWPSVGVPTGSPTAYRVACAVVQPSSSESSRDSGVAYPVIRPDRPDSVRATASAVRQRRIPAVPIAVMNATTGARCPYTGSVRPPPGSGWVSVVRSPASRSSASERP